MAGVAVAEAVSAILPIVLPHIINYVKERHAKSGSKQELSEEELKKVYGEKLVSALNRIDPLHLHMILKYIDTLRKQGIPDEQITPKLYSRFPEFADLITSIVSEFHAQETGLPISVRVREKEPDDKIRKLLLTAMKDEALAIMYYTRMIDEMKKSGEKPEYIDLITHIKNDEEEHRLILEKMYREKFPIEYPYSEEYD